MSRLLAAVATLLALCLVAPVAPASAAGCMYDDTCISTEVKITVNEKVAPGQRIKVKVEVAANTDDFGSPKGKVEVKVQRVGQELLASGGTQQAFGYDGSPITADIGTRSRGEYEVTAVFTPAEGSVFRGSSATERFAVTSAVLGTSDAGILPNTGGPGLWWLLLAALLVAGGAGAVVASRRRSVTV